MASGLPPPGGVDVDSQVTFHELRGPLEDLPHLLSPADSRTKSATVSGKEQCQPGDTSWRRLASDPGLQSR
jgi:hypothetical protein